MISAPLLLNPGQWMADVTPKSLFVLHHTVGGSIVSTLAHWNGNPDRVGTQLSTERNGVLYQHFPLEHWAIQLYRQAPWITNAERTGMERRSVGLEMASEGALTQKDGMLWAFGTDTGKKLGEALTLLRNRKVVCLQEPWRGYQWFDEYDAPQLDTTIKAVVWACTLLGIPKRVPHAVLDFRNPPNPRTWLTYSGVVPHWLLRPDKTDVHPLFPWERLARALGDPEWGT